MEIATTVTGYMVVRNSTGSGPAWFVMNLPLAEVLAGFDDKAEAESEMRSYDAFLLQEMAANAQ